MPELTGLGLGEAAALRRYIQRRGRADASGDLIVSDDRQFLRYLDMRERRAGEVIRCLNVAQFIAECAINGLMTKPQALSAISRIRTRIPEQFYNRALQRLELL